VIRSPWGEGALGLGEIYFDEGTLGVVRKSTGSYIFMFYCIFMTKNYPPTPLFASMNENEEMSKLQLKVGVSIQI
jgi:hypothetical protein